MANQATSKLTAPAIGLIITGVFNAMLGIGSILSVLLRLTGVTPQPNRSVLDSEGERIGELIGFYGTAGVAVVSLLLAPVVIYAGVQMLRGKGYGTARIGAILALIPITSCCFLLGAPFGIWALIVLGKPEVKAAMQNNQR